MFSALAIISWVCYLRVGEAAGIRVSDLAMPGFVQFWNSKTGEEGYTTRPLYRYADGVRAWLHRHMVSLGRSSDMLVWQSGEAGLEAGMAETLASTARARARWHALRRGGAAATWARKPDLAYYKWWGRWQSTAVAMQYGTKWSDPGVVAPTVLPAWSSDRGPLPTPERVGVLALWGSPMFPSIAGALSTPTQRKPRRPRGQGQGSTESGTVGSGDEGDQAATEQEESAEDGPAEMGPGPEAAPTPPPLQPLASASERGAVSRGDAGQLCTLAGPLVAVGGGGGAGRGRQPGPSMSIPTWTPTTTARVPEANPMAPSQSAAPGVPPGVDRPELPGSWDASVSRGPRGQPLVLSEEGPGRARKLEWWAVSTAHIRGRVALRWSWVVRRPCDPEPPHAVKLGDLVWPSRSIRRHSSAPSSGQAGMSRRRRRKARWRVPSWLQLSASRPRLGGGRAQWRRPPPLYKGPDRGRRVQEQAPLFLEFMQALTPHFHWIAERERCGLWMVAKRVDLWLNRVFDTAEDFRLRKALPALLSALRALHPDSWEACLHVNTSPILRFMGGVEDAILDRGLGPVGTHQLPEDLWDAVVPPFYREGLRDFDVEREWQDGERVVRGATRWVSQQVQRIVQALRGAGVYEETADPPPLPPRVTPSSSPSPPRRYP